MAKKIYSSPQLVRLALALTKSGTGANKESSTGNGGCSGGVTKAPCS